MEYRKTVSVHSEWDVVVCGAGASGICAAIAAARLGMRVMLVERYGAVGGSLTFGNVTTIMGDVAKGSIRDEIARLLKSPNPSTGVDNDDAKGKLTALLDEAGVTFRLQTPVVDAYVEDGEIKGVFVLTQKGMMLIKGKRVIDATGDGDIAARAGAAFVLGREEDGSMQPATIMFKIGGVDYDRAIFPGFFEDYREVPAGEVQHLGKANLPFPAGHVLLYQNALPGVVTCNMTNCIGVDGTNAADLVKATVVCRNQMEPIVDFLRKYVPGYEKCYILSAAPLVGIRETRHFKGVQTLTEEDIREAKKYDNWVVTHASFNFDVHNMTGAGLDATGEQAAFKPTSYTIPYGCLVPEKIDGLLLAGRSISGTHMAHSNYRVMPICANMGQAAGIAAALCAKNDILPRALDVKPLQKLLLENGVMEP